MKPYPTKELLYFVGKVCSVFTTTTSRMLGPEDVHHYFLGVIESIDEHGIFLTQVTKALKVYIAKDHLISIAEEEVLDPRNPQHAEEIKQSMENMKKRAEELEKKRLPALKKTPYFDPEAMKKVAEDLNKNFSESKS